MNGVDDGAAAAAAVEALGEEKATVELVAGAEEGLLAKMEVEEEPDLIIWSDDVPVAIASVEAVVEAVFEVGEASETEPMLALVAGRPSVWEIGGLVCELPDSQ